MPANVLLISWQVDKFIYASIHYVLSFKLFLKVAMGQGQAELAMQLLHECATNGEWLCLKNLHLVTSWLPALEKVCGTSCHRWMNLFSAVYFTILLAFEIHIKIHFTQYNFTVPHPLIRFIHHFVVHTSNITVYQNIINNNVTSLSHICFIHHFVVRTIQWNSIYIYIAT